MKKIILSLFLLCGAVFAYDFEMNGKSYQFNEDELKFYEFKDFKKTQLSFDEVKSLFPEYEIILVSGFNNRKIAVKNSPFKTKKLLLLNDTSRTFHRFDVFPAASRDFFEGKRNIKSLILMHGKKNIRLKHPGGDEFEIIAK